MNNYTEQTTKDHALLWCCLLGLLLASNLSHAQSCAYVLDLTDTNNYILGSVGQTNNCFISNENWEVDGKGHCYLQPDMRLFGCGDRGVYVNFMINTSGIIATNDYIAVQIFTDLQPSWESVLYLEGGSLSSIGLNKSFHDVFIPSSRYDELEELKIRLLIESSGSNFPIWVDNGDLRIDATLLPLKLKSFTSKTDENGAVSLVWTTEEEENVAYFEIMRSRNTRTWTSVTGTTANNSLSAFTYLAKDHIDLSGTYYYRLKIVDNQGGYSFSEIASTKLDKVSYLEVFPTLALDYVSVNTELRGLLSLQVFDQAGKLIYEEDEFEVSKQINTAQIPAGMYYLRVFNEEKMESGKFIKTQY